MSFATLYEQVCNFQGQVIAPAVASGRTLKAPFAYPDSLDASSLPIFLNSFGNFPRTFLSREATEYRGTMTWTLYTAIAGTRETTMNQFDTLNWITETVKLIERYPLLEINGTSLSILLDPIEIISVEPLISSLRYPGNGQQLFWGGRITVSTPIAIDKEC